MRPAKNPRPTPRATPGNAAAHAAGDAAARATASAAACACAARSGGVGVARQHGASVVQDRWPPSGLQARLARAQDAALGGHRLAGN